MGREAAQEERRAREPEGEREEGVGREGRRGGPREGGREGEGEKEREERKTFGLGLAQRRKRRDYF